MNGGWDYYSTPYATFMVNSMAISGTDLLEAPNIYKVYVRALYPQDMALYGTVPPF